MQKELLIQWVLIVAELLNTAVNNSIILMQRNPLIVAKCLL